MANVSWFMEKSVHGYYFFHGILLVFCHSWQRSGRPDIGIDLWANLRVWLQGECDHTSSNHDNPDPLVDCGAFSQKSKGKNGD